MDLDSLQIEHRHDRFQLGHTFMAFGVFVALMLSILLSAVPTGRARAFGTNDVSILSNQARNSNGIPSLVISSKLSAAAQSKANHMVANNYFEHTAPDGTTGWYFMGQEGYAYSMAGENLAATNESATAVVDGWMNSPGHRANLLNASFSEVGYGIIYQGSFQGYQDVYYVVALYAKPAISAPAVSTNPVDTPQTTSTLGSNAASEQLDTSEAINSTEPVDNSAKVLNSNEQVSLNENVTPEVGLIGTTSGISKSLTKQNLGITKTMSLLVAGLSAILIIAGLWIEIARFIKHGSGIHTMRHSH